MSASTRRDLLHCPQCRLTFPTRSALHRHCALDHRPAADGAWITAQLTSASLPVLDRPATAGAGSRSTPAGPSAQRPASATQVAEVLPLLLLALASLCVVATPPGPARTLALLLVLCGYAAVWRVRVPSRGSQPPS